MTKLNPRAAAVSIDDDEKWDVLRFAVSQETEATEDSYGDEVGRRRIFKTHDEAVTFARQLVRGTSVPVIDHSEQRPY